MAAERVAVVGAGLMGHGIAQVFACAGHAVAITDERDDVLASVQHRVGANLKRLGLDAAPLRAIELRTGIEATVEDADVVIEAVSEDLELKRSLFEQMSRVVGEDTILATNTSVISIGEIASRARDPGRVVGTHWWNPPFLVPLVEVVQAEATRPATIEQTMELLARVGKSPIHVRRDIPGFVGNRLQHALWREALALADAGVCDPESIDRVVKESFGLRLPVLGPMENADLVGLDLTLAIHEYLLPHLDRTPGPSPLLRRLVDEGNLGMRTGRGLRSWTHQSAREVRENLLDHLARTAGNERHHPPRRQ
jgi:3-hydroxybutyryl-CoA dehydrogenase